MLDTNCKHVCNVSNGGLAVTKRPGVPEGNATERGCGVGAASATSVARAIVVSAHVA